LAPRQLNANSGTHPDNEIAADARLDTFYPFQVEDALTPGAKEDRGVQPLLDGCHGSANERPLIREVQPGVISLGFEKEDI